MSSKKIFLSPDLCPAKRSGSARIGSIPNTRHNLPQEVGVVDIGINSILKRLRFTCSLHVVVVHFCESTSWRQKSKRFRTVLSCWTS